MAKIKTVFYCKECGNESPKWIGHCPGCGAWNSYVEESVAVGKDNKSAKNSFLPETKSKPVPVLEISAAKEARIDMECGELNRVLGGGLVPGSLILLGGEPGMKVNRYDNSKFIDRGGRIPAPMQSLKN